ncbi:hypothetical protein EBZ39_05515 [bacterium]|nr:hypothetical protein [bacterium]
MKAVFTFAVVVFSVVSAFGGERHVSCANGACQQQKRLVVTHDRNVESCRERLTGGYVLRKTQRTAVRSAR